MGDRKYKGKRKLHPRTVHEGPKGEKTNSFTLSLTSALDGVGGQRDPPTALLPIKTRYPLYRRLGEPQGRSGRMRKVSPPPGFNPRTVQPLMSCYNNYVIPAHTNVGTAPFILNFCFRWGVNLQPDLFFA